MGTPDLIKIDDPGDERVELYRNQKDAWLKVQQGLTPADRERGLFMAEGEVVIRTLIESGREVRSVLVSEHRVETLSGLLSSVPEDVPVYVASRGLLESIVGFDMHRGVLAAGVRWPMPMLEELMADRRTLVVLEDIANHDNIGSVFRSAAALGGLDQVGVVLSPRCCDPLYRKAVRVSMGTVLRVRWTIATDWPECLTGLHHAGWRSLALTPASGATAIEAVTARDKVALVLGAEGPGLTREASQLCSDKVRIPIDPHVDSLNVAVAGAVALSHLPAVSISGPGGAPLALQRRSPRV